VALWWSTVANSLDVTDDELALLLDALEEAAFFRDARSHVMDSAVRRQARRRDPATTTARAHTGDEHRAKVAAYQALIAKLRAARQG
jgi:hypothetical protein